MAGPHVWIANTPSSWVAASFSTGLLPASGEDVRFDDSGIGDVVGGLNQAAVDLNLLQITDAYPGDIGTLGNPLVISAGEVDACGAGTLYYQDGNGTTDLVFVRSKNVVNAAVLTGSTITRLRVLNGYVKLIPTLGNITHLEIDEEETAVVDAVACTTFSPVNITMQRGVLKAYELAYSGSFVMLGGSLELGPSDQIGSLNAKGYIYGGSVLWNVPSRTGVLATPINGTIHLVAGSLDCSRGGFRYLSAYQWNGFDIIDPYGNLSLTAQKMEP